MHNAGSAKQPPEEAWDFDAEGRSGSGLNVLELRLTGGELQATAVRCPSRPGAPAKIYDAAGCWVAGIIDDTIILPRQGLNTAAAMLFHAKTPGVQHLWFCSMVKGRQVGRLLCRAKRAWLPPSSTWLFPPRAETHDVGGWYFEWEGYDNQEDADANWVDPPVFILFAALFTLDREAGVQQGQQEGQQPAWSAAMQRLWQKV